MTRQMVILAALTDAVWAQDGNQLKVHPSGPDPNPDAPHETCGRLRVDGFLNLARIAAAIDAAVEEPKP